MSNTIEKDIQLIQLVEKYKHLYDKKEPLYKDKIAIQNAWESISQEMKIPSSECQHRWDVIRNRYNKERKGHPSGSAGGIRKEWPCMTVLHFLQGVIVPRKRFGSFTNTNLSQNTVIEVIETSELLEDYESYNIEEIDDASASKQRRTESPPPPSQPSISSTSVSREGTPAPKVNTPRQRSRENSLEKNLNMAVTTLNEFVSNKNSKKSEEDSDMMFCLSLCETIKNIKDKRKKNKAKISILQTLEEFIED